MPVDLGSVDLAAHEFLVGKLILQIELLIKFLDATVLRDDITNAPGVNLPRLHALVSMQLKHLGCWGEVWVHYHLTPSEV